MKSLDPERLYRRGFTPGDFEVLTPNMLLLEPLRRPERMGGLVMTGADPRFEALAFRIVAHGRFEDRIIDGERLGNPLELADGDVITIRNALAEPVQPDRGLFIVDVRYAWGVLQRAAEAEEQARSAVAAEAEAVEDIRLQRAALVRF